MKYEIYKYCILTLISLYLSIFISERAFAEGISLGISPPLIKIKAKSPSLISTPIIIQNLSSYKTTLDISIEPFRPKDTDDGKVEYYTKEESKTIKEDLFYKNVKILVDENEISQIELGPKQEETVVLTLDINQQTINDYYFSIIFVSKAINEAQVNSDTATTGGIATNVIVTMDEQTKPKGHLSEFSTPFFLETGPVPFEVKVTNTGTTLFVPRGQIYVKNMFGQLVGKVDLKPVNILKDSSRYIPSVWEEKILFGWYNAELTVTLSDSGPHYKKTISFLAFPIRLTLGICVALFLFFVVRSGVKKRLR